MIRRNHSRARRRTRGAGLTAIELLIALAVVGILSAVVIPSFQYVLARNRLATTANRLQHTLASARITAVTRNLPVTFCAGNAAEGCHGDWSRQEWIVFTDRDHDAAIDPDDELLAVNRLLQPERVSLAGNGPFKKAVVFVSSGAARTRTGAFAAGRLRVCVPSDIRPNATDLVLIGSGRAVLEQHEFDGKCPPPGS